MLQFKCPADLKHLPDSNAAYPIGKDLVDRLIVHYHPPGPSYDPNDDGWICLIEKQGVDRVLTEVWEDWILADVMWEGITYTGGLDEAVYLTDNEKGFVFLMPDEPWLHDNLREQIECQAPFDCIPSF